MQAEQQKTGRGFFATASVVVAALDGIGLCFLIYVTTFVVPAFAKMFQELGSALPMPTQFLLAIPAATLDAAIALMLVGLILKEIMIQEKKLTLTINVVVGLGEIAYLFSAPPRRSCL